ncbi:MAG: hypothetical protein QXK88_06070 [Desulfurococcaceae archaeon]
MMKVLKVVIVTAEHHPYHKLWTKIAERLSNALNAPLEVKIEDYVYLVEHGDKDEFGMSWLPQILVQLDDNTIYPVLSRLPLNERLDPDEDKAIEEMIKKLQSLGVETPQPSV